MPTPYNRDFTRYKSSQVADLDCQLTGSVKSGAYEGPPFFGSITLTEAIEAGECISMVRVPRNFVVTDVSIFLTQGNTAVIGVGDPFCCGRFLGPIDASVYPLTYQTQAQGVSCGPVVWRLQKIGRGGDGCGFGYAYKCDTDIIITNGYGNNTFQQGGGSVGGTSMGGAGTAGPLAVGTVLGLLVDGYINQNATNLS